MRMLKGLENIHSVIDRHEKEWKIEQGEVNDIENLDALTLEENVRRRLTTPSNPSGRFSADRFLGTPSKKETEIKNEQEETGTENNVEAVSVIKTQDKKNHSWLYNEVVKAINDAVGNEKNVKVVAVFVPVIQNAKEFEELPVDAVVNLPNAVNEDDVKFESEDLEKLEEKTENEIPAEPEPEQNESFDLLPESQDEPDEELADAFQTMEEKLDESLQEQQEEEKEENLTEEIEETPEEPEEEPELEQEEETTQEVIEEVPEEETSEEELEEVEEIEEVEPETEPEILRHEETELEPEQPVEIFEEEHEQVIDTDTETETEKEVEEIEEKKDNVTLPPLPDDLDDDEVYDDNSDSDNNFRLEDVVELI